MKDSTVVDERNLTEKRRTLGALLRMPYQVLQTRMYADLAGRGFDDIRPAHSAVFRNILPGGLRVTELADRAQMTKQSMAYLVDYLVEHTYATLIADPTDGRAKLVRLTQRGVAVQETLIAMGKEIEAELTQRIGGAEMAQLRLLLERLTDCLAG